MADSQRQKLVDAVKARFQAILTSGGYETDLGSNVFVWRDLIDVPLDPSELPACSVWDVKDTTDQKITSIHENTLDFEVHVVFSNDTTTAVKVRKGIADVRKAIGVDRQWTYQSVRLARDTVNTSDQIMVNQAGKVIGAAKINFSIIYRTTGWDPYTNRS